MATSTPVGDMCKALEDAPELTEIERVLDWLELADGRHVQLTAKLETDGSPRRFDGDQNLHLL